MIKVLILTHGNLAASLHDTLGLFQQEREGIEYLGLGVDMEDFKARLRAAVLDGSDREWLLLVDLFGGTPFNQAACLIPEAKASGKRLEIVTGLNLPMLLEVASNMDKCSLDDLKNMAVDMGRFGIKDLLAEMEARKQGGS